MIQLIDGFEADDKWGVTMLLEDRGCEERRFQTMRRVMVDDATEAAQRGAAGRRLGVVRKRVQVPLHGERRTQPRDEAALG